MWKPWKGISLKTESGQTTTIATVLDSHPVLDSSPSNNTIHVSLPPSSTQPIVLTSTPVGNKNEQNVSLPSTNTTIVVLNSTNDTETHLGTIEPQTLRSIPAEISLDSLPSARVLFDMERKHISSWKIDVSLKATVIRHTCMLIFCSISMGLVYIPVTRYRGPFVFITATVLLTGVSIFQRVVVNHLIVRVWAKIFTVAFLSVCLGVFVYSDLIPESSPENQQPVIYKYPSRLYYAPCELFSSNVSLGFCSTANSFFGQVVPSSGLNLTSNADELNSFMLQIEIAASSYSTSNCWSFFKNISCAYAFETCDFNCQRTKLCRSEHSSNFASQSPACHAYITTVIPSFLLNLPVQSDQMLLRDSFSKLLDSIIGGFFDDEIYTDHQPCSSSYNRYSSDFVANQNRSGACSPANATDASYFSQFEVIRLPDSPVDNKFSRIVLILIVFLTFVIFSEIFLRYHLHKLTVNCEMHRIPLWRLHVAYQVQLVMCTLICGIFSILLGICGIVVVRSSFPMVAFLALVPLVYFLDTFIHLVTFFVTGVVVLPFSLGAPDPITQFLVKFYGDLNLLVGTGGKYESQFLFALETLQVCIQLYLLDNSSSSSDYSYVTLFSFTIGLHFMLMPFLLRNLQKTQRWRDAKQIFAISLKVVYLSFFCSRVLRVDTFFLRDEENKIILQTIFGLVITGRNLKNSIRSFIMDIQEKSLQNMGLRESKKVVKTSSKNYRIRFCQLIFSMASFLFGLILVLLVNFQIIVQQNICVQDLDYILWNICFPRVLFPRGIFRTPSCGYDKCISLNANKRGLTTITPKVSYLSNIKYIWLEDNFLSNLPVNITTLRSLERFQISGNPAASRLNWSSSGLTEVPQFLRFMDQLIEIDMSTNRISNASRLSQNILLESIQLNSNRICTFPFSENSNLRQLTALDLSDNCISSLPESIFLRETLPNLISLDITNNPISFVSPSLTEWFRFNISAEISFSFTELDWSWNKTRTPLVWIPPMFSNTFPKLQKLDISNQMLSSLVFISSEMLALRASKLSLMISIDPSFCLMRKLQYLDISYNSLAPVNDLSKRTGIPDCLKNMPSLSTLNVSFSQYCWIFMNDNLYNPYLKVLDMSFLSNQTLIWDSDSALNKYTDMASLQEWYLRGITWNYNLPETIFKETSPLRLRLEMMPNLTLFDFAGCRRELSSTNNTVVKFSPAQRTSSVNYMQKNGFTCQSYADNSFTCRR